MNKLKKIILITLSALIVMTIVGIAVVETSVEVPETKVSNGPFKTLPVKLGEKLPIALAGKPLDYSSLTPSGKKKYQNDLSVITNGQWLYFNNHKNILLALNEDKEVAIAKIHYSFKDANMLSKYLDSLSKSYPYIEQHSSNSTDTHLIISEHVPEINYSTMNSYLTSILKELKQEKASDRMSFERGKLFIEVDHVAKTAIETYIDFKLAPRWSNDYVVGKREALDDLIADIESEFAKHNPVLLNSTTYMKYLVYKNDIHIF